MHAEVLVQPTESSRGCIMNARDPMIKKLRIAEPQVYCLEKCVWTGQTIIGILTVYNDQ